MRLSRWKINGLCKPTNTYKKILQYIYFYGYVLQTVLHVFFLYLTIGMLFTEQALFSYVEHAIHIYVHYRFYSQLKETATKSCWKFSVSHRKRGNTYQFYFSSSVMTTFVSRSRPRVLTDWGTCTKLFPAIWSLINCNI